MGAIYKNGVLYGGAGIPAPGGGGGDDTFVVETILLYDPEGATPSIEANEAIDYVEDISVTGYTPIGIMGIVNPLGAVTSTAYINEDNEVVVKYVSLSNTAISFEPAVKILYKHN